MNKKRVLFLSQWFDPEPTSKGLVFARELLRLGFEVEVLTGFPNYPGGNIYQGYQIRFLQREVIDGVVITRVPLYPSHDKSFIKRLLNYVSFAASATIYGVIRAYRPDVIYAYHPPLTTGVAAVLIKLFRRVPVVYDIQDMWPDTLRATGMLTNPQLLDLVSSICHWVYCRIDHFVVLSPGFKRLLVERGVPENKLSVIYNWADEVSLSIPVDLSSSFFPGPDYFRILFAGNIGKAQALDTVLEAASLLQLRSSKVCFVLLGGGLEVERLRADALKRSLSNVVFLPPVPMSKVGSLLSAADVLLVHLRKDKLFEITIPSKTQAYMMVGKPILMAVDGDATNLVYQSGCGVFAESENAESLALAAQQLSDMSPFTLAAMSKNAQSFYWRHLSLANGARQFSEVFHQHITRAYIR